MLPPLDKHLIRDLARLNDVRHTQECRTKPGNVKGDGGHTPTPTRVVDGRLKFGDLGGYRCICDFMDRIKAIHATMVAPEERHRFGRPDGIQHADPADP